MLFNFTRGSLCHESHLRELLGLSWTAFLTLTKVQFLFFTFLSETQFKEYFKIDKHSHHSLQCYRCASLEAL